MPLIQSIEFAREDRVGQHGVSAKAYEDTLKRSADALASLRKMHADKTLRLSATAGRASGSRGDHARRAANCAPARPIIVILGIGGSSLGGQTLAQLADYAVPGVGVLRAAPRIHFMDNLDPRTFGEFLSKLPLATTRFVCVSKSGGTGETLMQTIAALTAVKAAKLDARIPEIFLGLTEPAKSGKRNGLRDLLAAQNVTMLDHDTGVGGRFSVLTNVGLLPAAALGLDIAAIRAGAAASLAPVLAGKSPADVPAAVGAALSIALAQSKGKTISVMMAYADRLEKFVKWYVQLWAESLGKDGKGTTPVGALGPVDQHSQLQLFIAGPRDKLFTVDHHGNGREGPAHRWRAGQARGRSGILPARPSAISSPRRAARPSKRWRRTAVRFAHSTSRRSTHLRSANC